MSICDKMADRQRLTGVHVRDSRRVPCLHITIERECPEKHCETRLGVHGQCFYLRGKNLLQCVFLTRDVSHLSRSPVKEPARQNTTNQKNHLSSIITKMKIAEEMLNRCMSCTIRGRQLTAGHVNDSGSVPVFQITIERISITKHYKRKIRPSAEQKQKDKNKNGKEQVDKERNDQTYAQASQHSRNNSLFHMLETREVSHSPRSQLK